MTDTFQLGLQFFHGHVVENCFVASGAPATGGSRAGLPKTIEGTVSGFWHQPPNRLQVADSLPSQGPCGFRRSLATTTPLATASEEPVDQGHHSLAPLATPLGAKKIHHQLRRQHPRDRVPCVRTIQRWLHRLGRIPSRPRRARWGPTVP